MKNNYCVYPIKGVYKVGYIGPCGDFHALGDIRSFDNFDEAANVARRVANGSYGYKIGNYVNMR